MQLVSKDRAILIHAGNNGANTEGCILPGTNKTPAGRIDAAGKITLDRNPPMGAAIYNRGGDFLLSITKSVIEKIIK